MQQSWTDKVKKHTTTDKSYLGTNQVIIWIVNLPVTKVKDNQTMKVIGFHREVRETPTREISHKVLCMIIIICMIHLMWVKRGRLNCEEKKHNMKTIELTLLIWSWFQVTIIRVILITKESKLPQTFLRLICHWCILLMVVHSNTINLTLINLIQWTKHSQMCMLIIAQRCNSSNRIPNKGEQKIIRLRMGVLHHKLQNTLRR